MKRHEELGLNPDEEAGEGMNESRDEVPRSVKKEAEALADDWSESAARRLGRHPSNGAQKNFKIPLRNLRPGCLYP